MKPSGIEWIGDIPDDWEIYRLKNEVVFVNGYAFDGSELHQDKEVSVIRIGDISSGVIDYSSTLKTNVKSGLSEYELRKNDILIAMSGATTGKTAIVKTNEKAYINQRVGIIRATKCNIFIKYLLETKGFFNYIFLVAGGSAQPNISMHNILNFQIPKIRLDTQQKIADYLDEKCGEIDATIAKQKEIIEKLKAYKQSLISETVTKGLDKSAPLKPSGIDYLGDIPSHWEIRKLKYVANFNQNTLPEDTDGQFEFKYIDIGNVSSVDGIKEIQYFNFSNAPSRARRIVKYGDIIVSTVRTYLRAITSIKEDYDNCICSTGFAVITPKDNFQQDFVVYAIENESFIAQIIANSQGISYPAINVSQLENLKLAFPSVKEQKEIVDFLKTKLLEIDSIINKKQNIIQKLDTYKKSLIFEYVTGKKYV